MIAKIVEILFALLKAIPTLERLFTKSTTEKVEDKRKQVESDMEHLKETGRPKWH